MSKTKEALEMARTALENLLETDNGYTAVDMSTAAADGYRDGREAMRQELGWQVEPEVWFCPDCGTISEEQKRCCPDWIRARKVPVNFANTCAATFDRAIAPSQQAAPWQELSEVDVMKLAFDNREESDQIHYLLGLYKAISAALRAKNGTK